MNRLYRNNGKAHIFQSVVLCLGVVGTFTLIVFAQASRPNIKIEAEQGSVSGQTSTSSDLQASGGSYLGFGSSTGGSSMFRATFDTAADFYDRFQIDVHLRDPAGAEFGRVFPGDHDMSCGAPTTQRDIHLHRGIDDTEGANLRQSELFWWCAPGGDAAKGHIMTGMADIDGYTILSFSPNQSFRNVTKVCWDVNSTDLGGRKWTQAMIIPETTYQANGRRIDYISPTTSGVDTTALPLVPGSFIYYDWDHKIRTATRDSETEGAYFDWLPFRTTDKAKRYLHCMTDLGNGSVRIDRQIDPNNDEPDGVRTITVPGSFPDHARVIFQDDNYTPEKDGPLAGFTWHWDNIIVE